MLCTSCKQDLPDTSFYTSNKSRCKECVKASSKKNRAAKLEYYKEYDRQRGRTEERKARVRQYQRDNKEKVSERKHSWAYSNPVKRKCQSAVGNALRDGRLHRQGCWVCGSVEVEAHHAYYDLDAPLDIIWLCLEHHKECHRKQNEHSLDVIE